MSNLDEHDDVNSLERKDTAHKLPIGWLLLFIGLIVWGIYYYISYTPAISGWSQDKSFQESIEKQN